MKILFLILFLLYSTSVFPSDVIVGDNYTTEIAVLNEELRGLEISNQIKDAGKLDLLNKTIENVATPVNSTDAATKSYVDTQISSNAVNANSTIKGWASVTYSGGTPTLQDSYNVAGVDDTAQGKLTVNWVIPFASTNYAVTATARQLWATSAMAGCTVETIANDSVVISIEDINGALVDPLAVYVMAIGDQ